jgi:hypothetical protein
MPADAPARRPRPTLESAGFLDGNGVDVRQLSFARGRSTICAYDDTATVVVSKTIRTKPARDRLRITVQRQTSSATDDVLVSATGYLGRAAASPFADAADQHHGTVLVTATPRRAPCPERTPDPNAPRVYSTNVAGAYFSTEVGIASALAVSRSPRLCAYLTGPRRVPGGVQTRAVARAQTLLAAAKTDSEGARDVADTQTIIGRILVWIIVVFLIAAVAVTVRFAQPAGPTSTIARRGRRTRQGTSDAAIQPIADAAQTSDAGSDYDFVQRRRDEEVGFAIQRAVGATADAYRDRLRRILEHRDGPDWLDAFNRRRRADMLAKGQGPPATYASFEPRAVLNCLAHDPAGLQLIDLDAAEAAHRPQRRQRGARGRDSARLTPSRRRSSRGCGTPASRRSWIRPVAPAPAPSCSRHRPTGSPGLCCAQRSKSSPRWARHHPRVPELQIGSNERHDRQCGAQLRRRMVHTGPPPPTPTRIDSGHVRSRRVEQR